MPDVSQLVAALLIGLGSSGHCMGMCGGIAAGFSSRETGQKRMQSLLLFNSGRLVSYTMLGLTAGFLVSSLPAHLSGVQLMVRVIAGLMLVMMGFYISGWWPVLARLEKFALPLWVKIQPAISYFQNRPGRLRGLWLGMLWGFLPCGLVYSSLVWASSSGPPLSAALLMLFMGLGTLPTLLTLGFAGAGLVKTRLFRQFSGVLLIGFGVWTLAMPLMALFSGPSMSMHH